LLFDHFVSSSRLSGMKGIPVFISVIVFAASTSFGQENAPEPSAAPGQPGQPRPPGLGTKPGTPAQNIVAVPVPVAPPQPNGPVQKSLVRITATEVAPDYRAPWNAGMLGRGVGAGFVIDGNRIMTNAHVVSNSRYLTVERDGDPNKYPAKVLFVAHDCDLALITVDAPNFYKNMLPLKFGGIPELESTVSAYGYPIGGERVEMPEVVERKFKHDSVKFDIWRDKQSASGSVQLDTVPPYLMQSHKYDVRPRYVLYGGLLFQPLSLDLLEAYQPTDLRLRHFFDFYVIDQLYLEHPDVIVLTNILPDPINSYLAPYRGGIVDQINGKKIRTLGELSQTLADPADRFVIDMVGDGPPLVLDPKQIEAARERIRQRYNVVREQNLQEQPTTKASDQQTKI
jgi:hypothetical protein